MNRVLIFEPDSVRGNAYKEQLEKKHYWVVAASNAEDALALVKKQLFHVCLWSVENESDVAHLQTLKNLRPWSGIIATSTTAHPALIVAAIRSGASDFWVNDSDVSLLGPRVHSFLPKLAPKPMTTIWPIPRFPTLWGGTRECAKYSGLF